MMKKRSLGAGGPKVFPVGLGAMSIIGAYGPSDEAEAHALFAKALDLGVDHLDTSNVYGAGRSEERIGSFLAKQGARKNDLFKIATKAGIRRENGVRFFDNSAEHLTGELDKSLRRLGVERVDLFYVHRKQAETPVEETTEALAGLVRSGKIGAFGYSEIAPTTLARAAAVHPVAAVQSEYSLSVRSPELGLVQRTRQLGATLVAFSPVGRGLLTDRPPNAERVEQSDFLRTNPRFNEPQLARNIKDLAPFQNLAREMGVATATLAIAWVLSRGDHVLPIPGTRSTKHLEELVAGAGLALSPTDLVAIERVLPVGWCHGDRYNENSWNGPEKYC